MAWTSPRTWTTGELVTSSLFNTHVRDNLSYLKDSPTFDGSVIVSGTLTVSGFGAHVASASGTGGNTLGVRNPTAGTGNYASLRVGTDTSSQAAELFAFSSTYSPSGPELADGVYLRALNAGGLSIGASNASGSVRIYAGGTTKVAQFDGPGLYSLGSRGGQLSLAGGAFGTGEVTGTMLLLGNNTSGSGAPGLVGWNDKAGTILYTWADSTGVFRIGTSPPHADGTPADTSGTVVGSQSSTRASKVIEREFKDTKRALRTLLKTPLFRFRYKSGAYNQQRFIGITTDDSPEFGMDQGRSFNPVSAFGYTVAAIKEIALRIERIEKALA